MTTPNPSPAWIWDKFKFYSETNDAVHGRMLGMIARLEEQNGQLLTQINDLNRKLNNLIAQEGLF